MSSLLRISLFLIVGIVLVAGFGCTQKKLDDGKIPITTSSKEARELYLRARDLQDKFLFQIFGVVFVRDLLPDDVLPAMIQFGAKGGVGIFKRCRAAVRCGRERTALSLPSHASSP